jgi:hypothetical protein
VFHVRYELGLCISFRSTSCLEGDVPILPRTSARNYPAHLLCTILSSLLSDELKCQIAAVYLNCASVTAHC